MAKKAAASAKKAMSKSELLSALAEQSGLGKKEVASVLDGLEALIGDAVSKKGSGVFVLPGLLKIQVKETPAKPARPGRNPKTGEAMTIPAKKAGKVVRARVLKKLKERV